MVTNRLVWLGLFVGSTVGGAVPMLWAADVFSMSSIVGSVVGAFVGIWVGWWVGERI